MTNLDSCRSFFGKTLAAFISLAAGSVFAVLFAIAVILYVVNAMFILCAIAFGAAARAPGLVRVRR